MADKYIQLQSADGLDNLFPLVGWDLLWTNSSPTANFGAQTIQMDLSKYQLIMGLFETASGGWTVGNNKTFTVLLDRSGRDQVSNIGNYIVYRNISFNNSGIVFGTGKYSQGYNGTVTDDARVAVPLKLYGLRVSVNE